MNFLLKKLTIIIILLLFLSQGEVLAYYSKPDSYLVCEKVLEATGGDASCHTAALDGGPLTYAQIHNVWWDDLPDMHFEGGMSYYSSGVFDRVVDPTNQMSAIDLSFQELSEYDGYIALPYCYDIGRVVFVTNTTGQRWRLLVADCAAHLWKDNGAVFLLTNDLIGEVDWETAIEMGLVNGPKCCFTMTWGD